MSALRFVLLGADAPFTGALRDIVAAQVPEAAVELLDPARLKSRPMADAVVIDGRADAANGAELAGRLRAIGFAGAIVLVADAAGDTGQALAVAGAAWAPSSELESQLVTLLADQLAIAGSEHAPLVMRARRLVAAGRIATGFQHALNNPLTGILAEAQLMQLDPLPPEQREALERIVVLCRRIVELGKSLDGLSQRT